MTKELRRNLKNGRGDISFVHHVRSDEIINCRLLTEITVSVGASIGEHTHVHETEIYIIHKGKGVVIDNGIQYAVEAGDVVVTKSNETHSIANEATIPLVMTAIIITH